MKVTTVRAALALLLVTAGSRQQMVTAVDPAFAQNITVYHINPLSFGAVPLNMDIGDAAGDLFFDLWEVIAYPIFCPDGPNTTSNSSSHHHHHSNCDNPETFGNLVVNKLTLEVDSRFSGYAMCNIGSNGTDGHGHPCADDTYCCSCGGFESRVPVPCNRTLGFENISSYFGDRGFSCELHNASDPTELASCWTTNSVRKFSGETYFGGWYSALDLGCADPVHPTDDCTWRVVSVDAVIHRACHNEQFFAAVASYNQSCFDACPMPAGGPAANTSDFCHVGCFYETALGPGASVPGGTVDLHTGIPTPQLVNAWLAGFRPEAEGGCPRVSSAGGGGGGGVAALP